MKGQGSPYSSIVTLKHSTSIDGIPIPHYSLSVLLRDLANISQGIATSGKGAGARPGDWRLFVVESGDIEDDGLRTSALRTIDIPQNVRTEKHLLRPYDVLVTARSQSVKVALVPPAVTRTVAASTLLVVRAHAPEAGMAHFLWYYLTSTRGRMALERQVHIGASIPSLSASAVAEIEIPLPPRPELHRFAKLVKESEQAYEASLEAARLRREALRDAIIEQVARDPTDEEERCR